MAKRIKMLAPAMTHRERMMGVIPPYSPDALRAMMRKHHLTSSVVASMLHVNPRTVRRWACERGSSGSRAMPAASWHLLMILISSTVMQRES